MSAPDDPPEGAGLAVPAVTSEPLVDPWRRLRNATSARVGLGRVGDALPLGPVLDLQLAHAQARDAVYAALDEAAVVRELDEFGPLVVRSAAPDRGTYLQRPDLGRRLAPGQAGKLPRGPFDGVVVIADGLSATAVQRQGAALARLLLAGPGLSWAPPVVALQGRVALGDEVAVAMGARLVVVLIGERPGLSSIDSVGAYVTFAPEPGVTKDAGRNCVSNVRPGGLSLADAAARVLAIGRLARALQLSGTALKEDDALRLVPTASPLLPRT